MSLFLLLNTKEDILNDFYNDFKAIVLQKNAMEDNGVPQLFSSNRFSISSFVFSRKQKLIQLCKNFIVSK